MLLIWGLRTRAKTLREDTFLCPHCGADRCFNHKLFRRWFTLFFIPLIPLKVLGEYVECATCKQRFKTAVLQGPTNAGLQANLQLAVLEALATLLPAEPT